MNENQRLWLEVAEDVMKGAYDGRCEPSVREALTVGLKDVDHIRARQALMKLEDAVAKPAEEPKPAKADKSKAKKAEPPKPQPPKTMDLFG